MTSPNKRSKPRTNKNSPSVDHAEANDRQKIAAAMGASVEKGARKTFLTKVERQQFKRFRRSARKVGLLVTRNAYALYFRGQ